MSTGQQHCLGLLTAGLLLAGAPSAPGQPLETQATSLGSEMVLLSPGSYERGLANKRMDGMEAPTYANVSRSWNALLLAEMGNHEVTITKPFWIASREVTVGEFRKFVEETGYVTSVEQNGDGMLGTVPPKDVTKPGSIEDLDLVVSPEFNWRNPGFDQTDAHPVVGVSYRDAKAFCEWLSKKEGRTDKPYRLPTEAEWEFACRAGTDTLYWFGDDPNQAYQYVNIASTELEKRFPGVVLANWLLDSRTNPGDGYAHTSPVGSHQANPWGLHDIIGNVWEWCEDPYHDAIYQSFAKQKQVQDPVAGESTANGVDARVVRGGSYHTGPTESRAANRAFWVADDAACYLGFRIARDS